MTDPALQPLLEGLTPPDSALECSYHLVNGRQEHEDLLRNPKLCKELGLDLFFERTVFYHQYGVWIS